MKIDLPGGFPSPIVPVKSNICCILIHVYFEFVEGDIVIVGCSSEEWSLKVWHCDSSGRVQLSVLITTGFYPIRKCWPQTSQGIYRIRYSALLQV